jgi:hypothetical protein
VPERRSEVNHGAKRKPRRMFRHMSVWEPGKAGQVRRYTPCRLDAVNVNAARAKYREGGWGSEVVQPEASARVEPAAPQAGVCARCVPQVTPARDSRRVRVARPRGV